MLLRKLCCVLLCLASWLISAAARCSSSHHLIASCIFNRLEWCRSLAAPQTWAPRQGRWLHYLFFPPVLVKCLENMFTHTTNEHTDALSCVCRRKTCPIAGSEFRITANLSKRAVSYPLFWGHHGNISLLRGSKTRASTFTDTARLLLAQWDF